MAFDRWTMCPAIRERVESFGDTPAYARCYGWVLTFVLFVRMDLIAALVSTSRLDGLWRSFSRMSRDLGLPPPRADKDRD